MAGSRSVSDIKRFEYPAQQTQPEVDVADIELGQFFNRVENLVWTKSNCYYKEALEDCKERKKLLGEKLDRREKRVEELTNQIYNVVGFFCVFQGVILTAVSQLTQVTSSKRPLCGKVWFPLVLSGLAAAIAAVGIGLKFRDLNKIDKLIHAERLELREAEKREALISNGSKFKFKEVGDAIRRPRNSNWNLLGLLVIFAVFVFTAFLSLSFFVILCDNNPGYTIDLHQSETMPKVIVINSTEEEIVLKEGNAGIYFLLTTIQPRHTYTMSFEESATYREFRCAEINSNEIAVTLTSDDLIDHEEVKIEKDDGGNLTWEKNSVRRDRKPHAAALSTKEKQEKNGARAREGVFKSVFERFKSWIRET